MFTKLGALASGACPLERRTILLLTKSGCGGMSTQTAPEIAEFDFLLEVPGKQTPVLLLQILLPPILARNDSPACGAAAPALYGLNRVIGGGPIVGQFLTGRNFA